MSFEHRPENRNLFEWFRADPRGADSFEQWIEDRICFFLRSVAKLQYFVNGEWKTDFSFGGPSTIAQCMLEFNHIWISKYKRRIILLDGTVFREWESKNGSSA